MILIDWLVARKIPPKSPPKVFYAQYGEYPRMYFDTPKEANDYVNKCMAEEAEAKKKEIEFTTDIPVLSEPVHDPIHGGWILNLPKIGYLWYNKKSEAQKALADALDKKYQAELETKRIKYPENAGRNKYLKQQQQKNRNDLIDIYTPLYKKTVAASRITQNSYPAKYDWRKTLAILDEQRFSTVEKGDECYVALVTDTGFEHCTGWQKWIVKDSRYDSPRLTFNIPGNTTIVGVLVYKDSQIIMSNRLTAQRFHSDGTYDITLTYKRGG